MEIVAQATSTNDLKHLAEKLPSVSWKQLSIPATFRRARSFESSLSSSRRTQPFLILAEACQRSTLLHEACN